MISVNTYVNHNRWIKGLGSTLKWICGHFPYTRRYIVRIVCHTWTLLQNHGKRTTKEADENVCYSDAVSLHWPQLSRQTSSPVSACVCRRRQRWLTMMLRLVDGVATSLVVMSTCLRLNLASVLMTLRLGVTTLGVGIAVFSEHVLFAIALKALKNVKYTSTQ